MTMRNEPSGAGRPPVGPGSVAPLDWLGASQLLTHPLYIAFLRSVYLDDDIYRAGCVEPLLALLSCSPPTPRWNPSPGSRPSRHPSCFSLGRSTPACLESAEGRGRTASWLCGPANCSAIAAGPSTRAFCGKDVPRSGAVPVPQRGPTAVQRPESALVQPPCTEGFAPSRCLVRQRASARLVPFHDVRRPGRHV
jgi:hypothetical protein